MTELRVFLDHQMLATYPADHQALIQPDGSLQVVQLVAGAGGVITQQLVGAPIAAGAWHGTGGITDDGRGVHCAFLTPSATCPRCNGMAP